MSPRFRLDLLSWPPLARAARWPGFPLLLQVSALCVLLMLVGAGLGVGAGLSGPELLVLRKVNLATLVVWGLWWPAMIAVALVAGRAWCTACPLELVNHLGERLGRRLPIARPGLGRFLRAGWLVLGGYLLLQLLVAGLSLHRVPHYTALMLLVLLAGAFLAGVVFREPRAFCRAFCPASALLSVYGRYTPLQLETRDPATCAACTTRDCVRQEHRLSFLRRSCPSLLRPYHREPSDGCVLCLQCAKTCPHDNVGFGVVDAGAPVVRRGLLRPFEAAFVMVALGFVSHEVIGEVKWLDARFHQVPEALHRLFPALAFGWLEAAWFLLLFPAAAWALIALGGYLAGHRAGLRALLLAAATGAAPVVAVAHLAKAAAKASSWGAYLPLALHDPLGLESLRRVQEGSLPPPAALLGLTPLGWVMLLLVGVVGWRAWRWAQEVPSGSRAAARVGMAGSTLLFTAVLVVWTWPR